MLLEITVATTNKRDSELALRPLVNLFVKGLKLHLSLDDYTLSLFTTRGVTAFFTKGVLCLKTDKVRLNVTQLSNGGVKAVLVPLKGYAIPTRVYDKLLNEKYEASVQLTKREYNVVIPLSR